MIKQKLKDYFKELFKSRKLNVVLLSLFELFCIGAFIYLVCTGSYRNSIAAVLLLLVPVAILLVEWLFKIRIPFIFLLVFMIIPIGGLLGSSFEFYSNYPWFDDFLHALSGLIFACFGFTFTEYFIGKIDTKKKFVGCLIGGFMFSLAAGLIWEMIEYAGLSLLKIDMQEDSIIYEIRSFFLAGTHLESVDITDISETIINYGDGQSYVINGYLDIGLNDTLFDMFVCFLGALLYIIIFVVIYCINRKAIKFVAPYIKEETVKE